VSLFTNIRTGLVISCLLVLTATAHAQVSQVWVRHYDGNNHGNDYAGPMVVDHAGNVIVTGQSQGGFLTIKYSAEGDTVWTLADPVGLSGTILGITLDADDNIYVTGYTYTGWVYTGNMCLTSKYRSDGVRMWSRGFDGGGGPADDIGYGVAVDDSGYVYVTGLTTRNGRNAVTTLKYDSDGILSATWPDIGWGSGVRIYEVSGQNGYQAGTAIALDAERNVYVVGTSAPATGVPTDFITLKYDITGQEVWCCRYDGPASQQDTPIGIALDDSANVFVAGTAMVPNQSGATRGDYVTIKYDKYGNRRWLNLYNGPANYEDRCTALAVDHAGNAYVTGAASCATTDYATVKYAPGGDQAWVAFYDGHDHGSDECRAVVVDGDGCVYVTGVESTNLGMYDCATIKYDASGHERWTIGYCGPDLYGDRPTSIALGPSDLVYIHGTSGTATCWDDWMTVKYRQQTNAGADGGPITTARMDCSPNPFNYTTTIAFELPWPQHVTLTVHDLTGREITRLIDGYLDAGSHRGTFRADGLACGEYLCRLEAGAFTATRKVLLVR
jgi:hypothetical protein